MRDINEHTPGEDLIIKTAVRLMVPFAQLFGLYVIVHGHYLSLIHISEPTRLDARSRMPSSA